jgi:hypothetical protein
MALHKIQRLYIYNCMQYDLQLFTNLWISLSHTFTIQGERYFTMLLGARLCSMER